MTSLDTLPIVLLSKIVSKIRHHKTDICNFRKTCLNFALIQTRVGIHTFRDFCHIKYMDELKYDSLFKKLGHTTVHYRCGIFLLDQSHCNFMSHTITHLSFGRNFNQPVDILSTLTQ